MPRVSHIAEGMQTVLTTIANAIGREIGFIQRERKLNGSGYAQTLVLGWFGTPSATLEEWCQTAACLGIEITPQRLDDSLSLQASELMIKILESGVEKVITKDPVSIPLLQRFNGVDIQDRSTITLPDELKEIWKGGGGSSPQKTSSSVKRQVQLDLRSGTLVGPILQHGREHDRNSPLDNQTLPSGALRLTDLGYFSLERFSELNDDGVYWLTRVKSQCDFYTDNGKRWDLAEFLKLNNVDTIDFPIFWGKKHRIPCRLLAVRVPDYVVNYRIRKIRDYAQKKGVTPSQKTLFLAGWTVMATNAPHELMSLKEAQIFLRARWQIELLFKLWKKYGTVDKSRSSQPWRILTEVSAKLLGMIIQHWIFLTSCWQYPDRSLMKASTLVRKHATSIAFAFAIGTMERLIEAIEMIQQCLSRCRLNKRKKRSNSYQLLLGIEEP